MMSLLDPENEYMKYCEYDLLENTIKQQYQNLYENSEDLFRTINTDGVILDCNKTYANRLGYSKMELIGTSIFQCVADESLEAMHDLFEIWKRTGIVRNREVWLKRKDGISFPVLVSANNLYDEQGNMIGSNTVLRDITELYNVQKQLDKANDKLGREIREKIEFTNMISNEVKSAIRCIKNSTDTVLSQKTLMFDGYNIKMLEVIKLKSNSILKMLSDISDLHRIEEDSLSLIKNQHNLSQITNDVISKLMKDVDYCGIKIFPEIPPNIYCFCDKEKIEKVLTQIIVNAIEFSPKRDGEVHVNVNRESDHIKITVKDNSIGIKADNLDKIFEKFFQVDISILREHGGAGLGLSICKGIVECHQGKIWAESKGLGMGTEVHILLPITDENYHILRKVE